MTLDLQDRRNFNSLCGGLCKLLKLQQAPYLNKVGSLQLFSIRVCKYLEFLQHPLILSGDFFSARYGKFELNRVHVPIDGDVN